MALLFAKVCKKGRQEGLREGHQKGELVIIRSLLGRRFGTLHEWADERLKTLSTNELEDLSLRLLDAKSLNEVFNW